MLKVFNRADETFEMASEVVVALVVVALSAVKFWSVVEPVARRFVVVIVFAVTPPLNVFSALKVFVVVVLNAVVNTPVDELYASG